MVKDKPALPTSKSSSTLPEQESKDFVELATEEDPARAEIKRLRKERKKKNKAPKTEAELKKEAVNRIRKDKQIHVQGSDIPAPVET